MTNQLCKYLEVQRTGRSLVIMTLLFAHIVSCGKTLSHIPALLPLPQKVVWNGNQYSISNHPNWLVQRISAIIPGVLLNEDEAYSLIINEDSAVLTATSPKGLFRGLQTVKQLTFEEKGVEYVAGCSITDWPAFKIRGFMQDVGRNFMPLSLLKEQIDVMAAYKFNLFHLHLTDNPGWRLESKKYPQLNSSSSMSRWQGKYYTQEELLDLVKYCSERYITLVPEFDIPGHCEAFRRAFALDSMSDPRVQPILLDLIDELCGLVSKEQMPFLHLGTDEVWKKHELPARELLATILKRVKKHGRTVIVWRPGQSIEGDNTSVTQLWSSGGKPKAGHAYLDSRLNYLNHLDPEAGIAQIYFDRICGKEHGDSLALGGVLCCWNDNNVMHPSDILAQNPVYPGMLTYSETSWKGQPVDLGQSYLARIPNKSSPLYREFQSFESRLIVHRDLYFKGKPFPYLRQSNIEWSIIGPFDDVIGSVPATPVESSIEKSYVVEGKRVSWTGPYFGGTIHIRHFFGYPSYFSDQKGTWYAATNIWSPVKQEVGCWIGFHDWSRSAGRRGGPFPVQGQWHTTNPIVWLNGEVILPPVWNNPGLGPKTEEIPFTDENYFFRKPTKIVLKKGWNKVLLKMPLNSKSWKWMFTFVPVLSEKGLIREVEGLRFSTHPQLASEQFKLAPVFGEHMVFQQKRAIELFGTTKPGDQITISFGKQSGSCKADYEGNWKIVLPGLAAGGPFELKINVNEKELIDWKDILVGEVWFCSGQSNMEFPLSQSQSGKEFFEKASDTQLRLMNFHEIATTADVTWDSTILAKVNRLDYFQGRWEKCSPTDAAGFSAIAYHFGKYLREELRVPVGLIQVTVGGAPAESFVDPDIMDSQPKLQGLMGNWFNNASVMKWCRERAAKNISAGRSSEQMHPYMPGYIFEAGIAPFKGLPLKGVIWYQGESNAENPELYSILLPELVGSLRRNWNNPRLPFISAQLTSMQRPGWEEFRDLQRLLATKLPNTSLVVTSDLGDSLNVHPKRKREVGERFSLHALNKVYGKSVMCDSPVPIEATSKRASIVEVKFKAGQNLTTSDSKPLRELEVAGEDHIFHPVIGVLKYNTIQIDTNGDKIEQVRYAWKPFSRGNLVNREGLPASTFKIIVN